MDIYLSTIDQHIIRHALMCFSNGTTIITAALSNGKKASLAASTFNSVSIDPPLVLWSVEKSSSACEVFEHATHYAINVLSVSQFDITSQVTCPRDGDFAGIVYEAGIGGAPLLAGCAARFQCEKYQLLDGGEHWIFIAKVVSFQDMGRSTLHYHHEHHPAMLAHASHILSKNGTHLSDCFFYERKSNNIYYLLTQAIRSYQNIYQSQLLSTGLSNSEVLMLMVLDHSEGRVDVQNIAMPVSKIVQSVEILKRRGMVIDTGQNYLLTPAGVDQVEELWRVAAEHQDEILSAFNYKQIENFKTMLQVIIAKV